MAILTTTLDPAWPVYLPDPVNPHHPLNKSRVAWWLTLPNWEGGAWWYDLMGLYPGTLTQMTPASTNGWRTTTRPGGFAHLTGAGASTDGYVNLMPATAAPINLTATQSVSLACWFKCGSMTGFPYLVGCGINGSNSQGFGIPVQPVSGGNNGVYAALSDSLGVTTAVPAAANTGTDGLWHRALMVVDRGASALLLYLDGKLQISNPISFAGTVTPTDPMFALRRSTVANAAASVDDLPLWLRALSAADAWMDFDLGRQGYPGVLNRLAPGPAAGVADPFPAGYWHLTNTLIRM